MIRWIAENLKVNETIFTILQYPKWPYMQGGCLLYGRLLVRYSAEATPICAMQVMLKEYCPVQGEW